MQENIFHPEKIHLRKLFFQNGFIENSDFAAAKKSVGFSFHVNYENGFSLENNGAKCIIHVVIGGYDEDEKLISKASYEVHYYYQVENLNDLCKSDEENTIINVSPILLNALASITYSTTRGLIYARLQGTPLEKFHMPIIDPNELLKENEESVDEEE